MRIEEYITSLVSEETLHRLNQNNNWLDSELAISQAYLKLLRPFVRNPHVKPDVRSALLEELKEVNGSDTRLGAVNFRGLYQRNGRETILLPCGSFSPRTLDHHKIRHEILHSIYLLLVQKASSINQIFLATTDLNSLEIEFAQSDDTESEVYLRERHAIVRVSKKLTYDLVSDRIRQEWTGIIDFVLQAGWSEVYTLKKHIMRGMLDSNLIEIRNSATEHWRQSHRDIVFNNLPLFDQWRQVFCRRLEKSPAATIVLFEEWLRSLCWLQFYCHNDHAGKYFYTVRMPNMLNIAQVLPDSSLTLVTGRELQSSVRRTFFQLGAMLSADIVFQQSLAAVGNSFKRYKEKRHGKKVEDSERYRLATILEHHSGDIPFDFTQSEFFIKLGRMLSGQKHEGQELHFCIMFSFSRERIDAESEGLIEEVTSGLHMQWEEFATVNNISLDTPSDVAAAMSKWIKMNDLQLQPWDTALYFEEIAGHDGPVPASIVRILSASHHSATIGTELQLRHALRHITQKNRSTMCVIACRRGLIMFIAGKSFIIRCNSGDDWDKAVRPHVQSTDPIEESIGLFLKTELIKIFGTTVDATRINKACLLINKLCEALVSLGHGALILVGTRTGDKKYLLPPLNPIWRLRSTISDSVMQSDCITYALMAAMDGATEIILPIKEKDHEGILLGYRRSVQSITPIWEEDENGHIRLAHGIDTDPLELIGKGTRHHNALALSKDQKDEAIVITVSADGPVTIWCNGKKTPSPEGVELRYAP